MNMDEQNELEALVALDSPADKAPRERDLENLARQEREAIYQRERRAHLAAYVPGQGGYKVAYAETDEEFARRVPQLPAELQERHR